MSETKFLLETRFDHYVIESIFQFVFNGGKVSAKLEYIDRIVPEKEMPKAPPINSYRILDVTIPIRPVKPRVSPSEETAISNLHDDDQLINAALRETFPKMQEHLQYSFREALKSLAQNIHASYQLKINEYEKKLIELNARLSQHDTASTKVDMPDPGPAQKSADSRSEELQKMEFTELKKLARKLKISRDTLDPIKPTLQGINQLIDLIKSNDLFYSR